ncbi:MAG: WYL domain-containing protein [Lachnospiraceae bacterium]|nr:WYL domain-containing protein [Lachnospiraceae bacterium]
MPKSYHQKLKMQYIVKYLYEWTDEKHPVTTKQLIEYLAKNEIMAERKSIYDDIALLQDFGMDIIKVTGRTGGYYLASREFELAELKILVDLVQSSKFITPKKSRELIRKLEGLVSHHDAGQLKRQVMVMNRTKAVNESIYYNVDMIYNGIAENSKIRFQYFEWTVEKEMHLRRDGAFYEVSPYILTWDDENYYMIAYEEETDLIKHFRVDKMLQISLTDQKRTGEEKMDHLDVAAYTRKTFGMFAGEEETVVLQGDASMIGVIIDRFGQNVALRRQGEDGFRARIHVAVSPQFFGWMAGLGGKVNIVEPENVRQQYVDYLQELIRNCTVPS